MAAIEFDAKVNAAELNRLLSELRSGSQDAAKAINDALGGTVTKKLVLETVADQTGVKSLVAVEKERLSVTDKIIQQQAKLNQVERNSVTSLRQQVNEAKQARDQIAKYVSSVDGAGRNIQLLNDRWDKQNSKVQNLQRQLAQVDGSPFWDRVKGDLGLRGLINFGNGLTQITQGFQSASIIIGQVIGSVNQLTDSLANLQSFGLAFQAIGLGAGGAQQALQESSRIALNLGVGLNGVRTSFQQLTPVIQNSGGSINDVSNITEALSSRFAAFGISADKARRVTNGVIQAFAKGKLQAEEFTQQIAEADPAFGTDFAKALNVSTAELLDLIKAGKITSDVLIRTLPLLSKSSLLYGKLGVSAGDAVDALGSGATGISVTIDQVRNKIASLNQLSLERLSKSLQPFLFALLKVQASVTDLFTNLSKSSSVEALGRVLGGIANSIALIFKTIATAVSGLLVIIEPIAKIANALLAIPGIAELVSIAIGVKLVSSLGLLGAGFTKAAQSGGAFGQIVSKISSPITDLKNAFASLRKESKAIDTASSGSIGNYQRQAKSISTLAIASNFAATQADKYRDKISSLNAQLQKLEARRAASTPEPGEPKRARGGGDITGGGVLTGQINQIKQQLGVAQQEYEKLITVQDRLAQKSADAASQLGNSAAAVGRASINAGKASTEYQRLVKSLSSLTIVNSNATQGIAAAGSRFATVQNELTALNRALDNGVISSAEHARKFRELSGEAGRLTGTIDRLSGIQSSTGQRMQDLSTKIDGYASRTENAATRTAGFGRAIGNAFGSAAKSAIGGISSVVRGLASEIGILGGILIAAGIAQAAYQNATAASQEQIERNAASAKAYGEIIDRLNGKQLKLPEPTGLQKAWQNFSLTVADSADSFGRAFDFISQKIQELSGQIADNLNKTKGPLSEFGNNLLDILSTNALTAGATLFARATGLIGEGATTGATAVRQLSRDSKAFIDGIKSDTSSIIRATIALREFAAGPEGRTTTGQSRVAQEYKDLQGLIASTSQTVDTLKQRIADAEKEFAKTGSPKTQQTIKDLKAELTGAEIAFKNAKAATIAFAVQVKLLTDEALLGAASSIGSLNEKLKQVRANLENAPPESSRFSASAAEIAATEKALEDLQSQAKDPVVIRAGIELKQAENLDRAVRLNNELQKQLSKGGDPVVIANLRTEIQKLNRDIQNLDELKLSLDANSITNIEQEIQRIQENNKKLTLTDPEDLARLDENLRRVKDLQKALEFFSKTKFEIKLEVADLKSQIQTANIQTFIDPGPLRDAAILAENISQKIGASTLNFVNEIAGIQQLVASGNLNSSQAFELIRSASLQYELSAAKGSAEIADAGRQFKEQLEQASNKLISLKLSKPGFFSEAEIQQTADQIQVKFNAALEKARKRVGDPNFFPKLEGSTSFEVLQSQLDFANVTEEVEKLQKEQQQLNTAFQITQATSALIAGNFKDASDRAQEIRDRILSLDGKTVEIFVKQTPIANPRFAGGPVTGGQQYQVNELGREGFLSASGKLSQINAPAYGLWRAPGAGTVVPAHIMQGLDVPKAGVKVNAQGKSVGSGGMQKLARTIFAAMNSSRTPEVAINELARVQANQAMQIGKLSRVVNKLAEKDWNVSVNVRPSNSTNYTARLNSMI